MVYGGIEAGGTKMVCAIMDEECNIIERASIPTTTPEETIPRMVDYFRDKNIASLGIACFGPVDLNEQSDTYGYITRTPKEGWSYCDFVGPFKELGVPIGFDTDVNGAVYGEALAGAAKGSDTAIYITIGTGIGVGVYMGGKLAHGLMHPEAGHILLNRHADDHYDGCCASHKNCFEGLASGPSIMKRWGKPAYELYDQDKVWEIESHYIAQAITDYILCYSPEKIILWGGVMHKEGLLDDIREKVLENLGGYVLVGDEYIVAPGLGENAGVIGAGLLGKSILKK